VTFIKTIPPEEAEDRLKTIYDRIKGPDGRVDNILVAHSLRPLTLEAHMAMYKYVLHYGGNETPKWLLETIGVYVSMLNGCDYCVDHHCEGLRRLLRDDNTAIAIRAALERGVDGVELTAPRLGPKERAALSYVRKLTLMPATISASDVDALRAAGWDDGEILEINQVAAYFAYANRTVLGLGVNIEGDVLGLSPNNSKDENDWSHQ
jgi:uncharacterized peroxidase-related enzyme